LSAFICGFLRFNGGFLDQRFGRCNLVRKEVEAGFREEAQPLPEVPTQAQPEFDQTWITLTSSLFPGKKKASGWGQSMVSNYSGQYH
jgi:hypothetical protein